MKIKPTFEALPDYSTCSSWKDLRNEQSYVYLYTHSLCANEKHVSPSFLNIASQHVLVKISRLGASVLVTDIKRCYRNLYYGGDRVKSLVTTLSDWQPLSGHQGCKGQVRAKRD